MLKISASVLGGALFVAGFVFFAGGKPAAMLALGFLLALAAISVALYAFGLRRAARVLIAFSDGLKAADRRVVEIDEDVDHRQKRREAIAVVPEPELSSEAAEAVAKHKKMEKELAGGLKKIGADKDEALELARKAMIECPDGTFNQLFTAAIRLRKAA